MTDNVTVVRYNDKLEETDRKLQELMVRYRDVGVPDQSGWSNQALFFTRQLWNMLVLARVITLGALQRDESRGAHYKPDFPERDDARFLKTTVSRFVGAEAAPELTYEEVDIRHIRPRARRYDVAKEAGTQPPATAAVANTTGGNGAKGVPAETTPVGRNAAAPTPRLQ